MNDKTKDLGQYFTPAWAAEQLVDTFFPDLDGATVVEPSCGDGRFLQALPHHVRAIGVEIDPIHADTARRRTGREIVTGDFRTVSLPVPDGEVDALIGNPPYKLDIVDGMLARAATLLAHSGTIGFILPAYTFQTPSRVLRYAQDWRLETHLLPRTLFPGLSKPLVFALFRKSGPQWIGLTLYAETHDVAGMDGTVSETLRNGSGSVWRQVIVNALSDLGGEATLKDLYTAIGPRRPTSTNWWREKIRQVVRRDFVRTGPGRYALPQAA